MRVLLGGVDSAWTQRDEPGPGHAFNHRDYGTLVCDFEMNDGKPCGREEKRTNPNQRKCSRHGRTAHNFSTRAELRVRRPE